MPTATTSKLIGIESATINKEGQDSITMRYLVQFDRVQSDPYAGLVLAQAANPDPIPLLRAAFGTSGQSANIFVTSIQPSVAKENRNVYFYDVVYAAPEPNQQTPLQQNNNPLLRPGVRNIEYIASEWVIDQAKNVEALSNGNGNGGTRSAFTLAPIVNAAGKRPDEPKVDTEYNPVLTYSKNYASLGAIDSLNQAYQRTTNSDTVFGYGVRRLKYLVTESLGQQFENGFEFWPGTTRVEVKRTTDIIIDNVGYDYWDSTESKHVRADNQGEPINLSMSGDKDSSKTTITYRYLEDKPYLALFG